MAVQVQASPASAGAGLAFATLARFGGLFLGLPGGDLHHQDGVADHVSLALLARGPLGTHDPIFVKDVKAGPSAVGK